MAIHILYDDHGEVGEAVLVCSTSGTAFGPVFSDDPDDCEHDARARAEAFLRWLESDRCDWARYEKHPSFGRRGRDVRDLTEAAIESAYGDWLAQEQDQWIVEAALEDLKAREGDES